MKAILKKIISEIVLFESRLILKKYKPFIIAITGSVGKTSTKDAIYTAISSSYSVRKSDKSFNSEIGVPLTILGCPNGWSNVFIWSKNILKGLELIVFRNDYPKYIILEIGADHPGDIKKISKWLSPDIVIITQVSKVPAHIEFFKNPEELLKEKAYLAQSLKKGGTFIVAENLNVLAPQAGKTIKFGLDSVQNIVHDITGTSFIFNNKNIHITSVGTSVIYPFIIAMIVAQDIGIPMDKAISALENHVPPKGRMNILKGKNSMTLIDDTYNSSPDAVYSALETLKSLPGRRVAVLGDMLELGKYAVEEHKKVGEFAKSRSDLVISVGLRARGMNAVHHFNTSIEASEKINNFLKPNDVVLVKGSQGIRMERIVKALLDPSLNPDNVLVRQEKEWLNR